MYEFCAEIIIPDRYKFTLNGDSFLQVLFDFGEGDMYIITFVCLT